MLEELINLKTAIRKRKPKKEVREKYQEYTNAYQEIERDVSDKMRYKEITEKYLNYIYFNGRKE
jgi:hypothetical protein